MGQIEPAAYDKPSAMGGDGPAACRIPIWFLDLWTGGRGCVIVADADCTRRRVEIRWVQF